MRACQAFDDYREGDGSPDDEMHPLSAAFKRKSGSQQHMTCVAGGFVREISE